MEWKIGEIKQINGEWYQCISDSTDSNCNNCVFQHDCNSASGNCSSTYRKDKQSVAFKFLEKVGEPITIDNKSYQRYKNFVLSSLEACQYCVFKSRSGCTSKCVIDCGNDDFYVEIK